MKYLFNIAIISIFICLAASDGYAFELDRVRVNIYDYTPDNDDQSVINAGLVTSDNNIVLAGGESLKSNGFMADIFVVKLTFDGDTLWTRRLGAPLTHEGATDIIETSDGNLVVLCFVQFDGNFGRLRLYKLSPDGALLWEKTYLAETEYSISQGLTETPDHGLIITGESDYDMFLFKTNADGDSLWMATFGGAYNDQGGAVAATSDGGAILLGTVATAAVRHDSLVVMRVDASGTVNWRHAYPFNGGSGFWGRLCLFENADGDFVGAASSANDNLGYVYKWNAAGTELWSTVLHPAETAMIHCASAAKNDAVYFAGAGTDGAMFGKVDDAGDSLLLSFPDDNDFIAVNFIYQDVYGDVYAAGRCRDGDFYLMKLRENYTTSVDDGAAAVPASSLLSQNYPNPFNPSTVINYRVPGESYVTLKIYNSLGRTVATLVDGFRAEGDYTARWDGLDSRGERAASGAYLYRLTVGEYEHSRKMLLLR